MHICISFDTNELGVRVVKELISGGGGEVEIKERGGGGEVEKRRI